jgi:hypothetical protein
VIVREITEEEEAASASGLEMAVMEAEEETRRAALRTSSIAMVVPAGVLFGMH